LSNECTFVDNLTTPEECRRELDKLVVELERELRAKAADRQIQKAFVKLKFADFTRTTKECINAHPTRETYQMLLAEACKRSSRPIRLLGSGVRFVEEIGEYKGSSQQLLTLDHGAFAFLL
jgi:DNA polymerase-4